MAHFTVGQAAKCCVLFTLATIKAFGSSNAWVSIKCTMKDPYLRIDSATQPYLHQIGFMLTDLPVKDLEYLRESVKLENRKRGDVLFRQGAYPKGAFWVISGKVKIFQITSTGIRQTLYVFTNGDLAGYRQIITEEVYAVTAVLLEDSNIGFISNETFRRLLDTSPFFTRNVLNALAREFTVWMNRMTALVQFPVRLRLVLALLTLHEQYRRSGSPPGVITMTRTELAEYVGTSLETVVRALNALKSKGLVDIKGRRILLTDPIGLVDILQDEEP